MKLRLKGKYWGKYCDALTELTLSKFIQQSEQLAFRALHTAWRDRGEGSVVLRLSAKRHLETHKGNEPLPLFLRTVLLALYQRKVKSKGP